MEKQVRKKRNVYGSIKTQKIRKSDLPGDFYFGWKISAFRNKELETPEFVIQSVKEYESNSLALTSATNYASKFGIVIIKEKP